MNGEAMPQPLRAPVQTLRDDVRQVSGFVGHFSMGVFDGGESRLARTAPLLGSRP
jgi:hypothetical protein